MASCDRVLDLLKVPIRVETGDQPFDIESMRGHLQFQNVNFSYKDRDILFQNLSFDVPAGKTVALVGTTGSGKSSVAKLILRFIEPQSGSIRIDDRDISSLRVRELRQAIGLVSQDVFLFSDSIAANIGYGKPNASLADIKRAAKLAAADDFIESLPDGYDTLVGERGQLLSGGQKQRIGLARALVRNPHILILDEATSAVDNETERLIQQSFEQIRWGRTVLVIAHRLSTIRNADIILVMNQGIIVESGTYEELIRNSGLLANMASVQ
jgi:ATP-binding cassette subfamily B protein